MAVGQVDGFCEERFKDVETREALCKPEVGTALRLRGRQDGGEYSQSKILSLRDLIGFSPGESLAERR